MIYIDPPFNTGKRQVRRTVRAERTADGGREGFGGRTYERVQTGQLGYLDAYDDYLAFLAPKLEAARRLLTDDGTLFVHLDHREVHY